MLQQQFPKGGAQARCCCLLYFARARKILISQKAILAEAERLGLRVSDEELRDEIQHGRYAATFFPDGNFVGQDAYEDDSARRTHRPPVRTGSEGRDPLQQVAQPGFGQRHRHRRDVRQEFEQRNTKVKFDYAVLTKDDIMKGIHPSDAELKAYYDAHKATYNNAIPEKRKVKYVVLDTAKLQAQTQVSPAGIAGLLQPASRRLPCSRAGQCSPHSDQDAAARRRRQSRSKRCRRSPQEGRRHSKQVKAGGNFADLAKKYSEDTGSAKDGGSLGWISRGRTVARFEKAAFSLPKGGTSDVIKAATASTSFMSMTSRTRMKPSTK